MKISGDFKARVLARQWVSGTFLNLGSPVTVELAGNAGYDWILIDHEHGPGGEDTLLNQLQAASGTPAVPIVRIAANETAKYKRALDMGAHGVMVPYISTAEEALVAARAVRYPPRGIRGVAKFHRGAGFGADFEEYYAHAHDWIVLMAQIETREGVENAEAIARVEGVDVLFVGPTDLSYNTGMRDELEHADFTAMLRQVAQAAQRAGKAAGILVHSPHLVEKMRELGFTVVALGSDGGSAAAGLKQNAITLQTAGRP